MRLMMSPSVYPFCVMLMYPVTLMTVGAFVTTASCMIAEDGIVNRLL